MTISIFDSVFGRILRKRPGLERMVGEISAEYESRRICQETRKDLLKLSGHELRDIGISKDDAIKEANRGFWD